MNMACEQNANTQNDKKPTVLFVDDEKQILSAIKRIFRRSGYEMLFANSGAEALEVFGNTTIDLVVSDMRMPQMSGAQLFVEVAQRWPDTIRILLTGYSDLESSNQAEDEGDIYCRLDKPWDDEKLVQTVNQALKEFNRL